jgi:cell division protein FtsB
MRDIGQRIQRYRLSRFAPPEEHKHSKLRWVWLAMALWLAWVGVLSDHNFYRLWRLGRERAHAQAELVRTRVQIADLEGELKSPDSRRWRAEKTAREQHGWARPGEIIYRVDEGGRPKPER